jgi:iron complex outermembrane receptor protein
VSTDTVERFSDFRDSQSDGATTWRAGAVYLFDCGLAPYASYAKSFQPTGGTDFDNNPFKPTTGEQYEVGIKYQPRGVRAFMTLSAYQLTQQNVLTSDPAHPGFSTQTGEIRSRGIEVAGVAEPVAGLSLIASYAYLRNIVTKSNDVDNPFGSNLGKHPTGMPEHTASLWSDYTFQLGPLRGFGLGAGVRYVGATEGDALNTFKVPASTVVDAAVHYDLAGLSPMLKGLRLGVNVTNIADREYVASCDGVDFCAFGLRRTVVGTMTYRW